LIGKILVAGSLFPKTTPGRRPAGVTGIACLIFLMGGYGLTLGTRALAAPAGVGELAPSTILVALKMTPRGTRPSC
jgi:hypothetical protein